MISPGQSKLYYISTHGSYLFKNLAIMVAASSREMNSVGPVSYLYYQNLNLTALTLSRGLILVLRVLASIDVVAVFQMIVVGIDFDYDCIALFKA